MIALSVCKKGKRTVVGTPLGGPLAAGNESGVDVIVLLLSFAVNSRCGNGPGLGGIDGIPGASLLHLPRGCWIPRTGAVQSAQQAGAEVLKEGRKVPVA